MSQSLFTFQEFLELFELRADVLRLHGVAQRHGWVESSRHLAQAVAALPGDVVRDEPEPVSHAFAAYPHDEDGNHGPQGPCEHTAARRRRGGDRG